MWKRQTDNVQEVTEKKALDKAAAYCSAAEHCISEVRGKLKSWSMGQHAEAVIDRLIQENFINEERFCQCFVKEKIRYNKWGRMKVVQALRQKDLPDPVIQEAVNSFDTDEYANILRHLISAKARMVTASDDYEKKQKLVRFALGRGFEMPLITKYLNVEEDFE